MSDSPQKTPAAVGQMQCMEVWGGNRGVERQFQMPGLDVWIYSEPHLGADEGGDVYYLSSCASGRISRLLLADVCGHGIGVSKPALQLRDLMRRYVNSISQARFVQELNDEFGKISVDGRFATALVGTYFAGTGGFQLSRAGHPPPLWYRREKGRWSVWESEESAAERKQPMNTPLGIFEKMIYGQTQFPLRPGDLLLGYTDGLIEMRVGADRQLGIEGLLELVSGLDAARPAALVSELLKLVRNRASAVSDDDVTLLLAAPNGRQIKWWNGFWGLVRLFLPVRLATGYREEV